MELAEYDTSEEVKVVVRSVEQYRCRTELYPGRLPFHSKEDERFAEERAEQKIRRELGNAISDFVKIRFHKNENYAEGCLFLPYIADKKMLSLEATADLYRRTADTERRKNAILENRIAYLELPFYKRWFTDKP